MARLAATLLLAVGLLVALAGPAAADPAGPTNYRSRVTGTDPAVDAVDVRVFGGDSYVVLEVEPGHRVVVYGYRHDPDAGVDDRFLRIDEQGRVFVNRRSPAAYLNQDRYGDVELPADVDASAPPEWEQVADGGVWAWHDHRIHWMSPQLPPQVSPDGGAQEVFEWSLPLQVDGRDVTVAGELSWRPGSLAIGWILLGMVVLAAVIVAAQRRRGVLVAVAGISALLALVVGAVMFVQPPTGAGLPLSLVVLPAVAAAAVLLAVVAGGRTGRGDVLTALTGVPLVAWSVTQLGALTSPFLPTDVPDALVRATVAVVGGAGTGVLVGGVLRARTDRDTGRGRPSVHASDRPGVPSAESG